MMRFAAAILALVAGADVAHADRYEASIHLQPSVGIATVGEPGASQRATVPALGLAARGTYGLRHWLAVEGELGFAGLGAARFADVPITIDGGSPDTATLERTTRTGRVTVAATLRLGVAWIPTISAGVGGQVRLRTDATIEGTGIVPDGREGGSAFEPLAFARVGIDRRINRRLIVGISAGASRAFSAPAIDSFDLSLSVARYWYPLW